MFLHEARLTPVLASANYSTWFLIVRNVPYAWLPPLLQCTIRLVMIVQFVKFHPQAFEFFVQSSLLISSIIENKAFCFGLATDCYDEGQEFDDFHIRLCITGKIAA
ncbi:hypothetical protein [Legionella sp. MW5194]|uniref:hypothetical protein n=1 Tax=Legionella sp. MW5194 TaxID=2662448 RepID=UPI00193CBE67|nr:hypothetical protein [Legionella sp. MW5194]